jgi:hypothetical protein
MKVKDVIVMLARWPSDAEVMAYDADAQQVAPVTGSLFEPRDAPYSAGVVEIQTDEL